MIALSLSAVLISAVLGFVLSAMKPIGAITTEIRQDQAMRFAASRIFEDFSQSSGWLNGSTSSMLVLSNITYDFNAGKVRRQSGTDSYYLTTEGEIAGVTFTYPSPKLVLVHFVKSRNKVATMEAYARN